MTEFPSQESLQQRVDELRLSAPDSNEYVDAVWDLSSTLWFEPQRLMPMVEEALKVAERNEYRLGVARCQMIIAEALFIQVRYGEVAPYVQKALPVFVELNARLEFSWSMLIMAALSQMAGSYDQALEHCFEGRQAASEVNGEEVLGWLNYRTADVYRELGDTARMLEHAQSCFDGFESLYPRSHRRQHRIGMGRARTLVGAAQMASGNLDEAYQMHEKALEVYREVGDQLGETRALSDLATIQLRKGDLDDAEKFLRQSMQIREKLGHRASLASNLFTLGEIYLQRSETDMALTTLHDMLDIATEGGVKMRAYQAHEALARVFQASGYSDKALIHYKKYHAIKEDLAGEAMNLRVHNLKILSDIQAAVREAEIERKRSVELQSKNDELARLLEQLKATQDRLIQSEKMASLGQLTAGIAHEIRNPLNFVNNFSELTRQLVEETKTFVEERRSDLPDDVVEEFGDLIETLTFNAAKIQEHGKRADRIVQSMLEHSRGGEGVRMPTDLNKLVDDCLNLAYHGMRARDADFNVTIEKSLDHAIPTLDLVSQDIGRVFLNIIGNALDALGSDSNVHDPTVSVSTALKGSRVEVRIADNGPGIPDEIRTRIFDPFFTTKPSGSGTGLGLSLAYDIVSKGHGGSLELLSDDRPGATFVITLPLTAGAIQSDEESA